MGNDNNWFRRTARGLVDSVVDHASDVVAPLTFVVGGAGTGAFLVAASGMSAAGMVGAGTGIGAAAGPVGMVAGATTGLAVYAIVRVTHDILTSDESGPDEDDEPEVATS